MAIAVLCALSGFFIKSAALAWQRASNLKFELGWQLIIAMILFAVAVPISGVLWGRILATLAGRPIRWSEASFAHIASWLLRYIPGQVAGLAYKMAWGRHRSISLQAVATSYFYENVFLQIASLLPAALLLWATIELSSQLSWYLLLAFAIAISGIFGLVLIAPLLRWTVKRIIQRWTNAPTEPLRTLDHTDILTNLLLYLAPRIINGMALIVIGSTITSASPTEWIALGGIYVIAGALGILAIFVPSGLGVREGVFIVLAQPIIGTSDAIVLAVLARLVTLGSDAMLAITYITARAFWKEKTWAPEL